MKREYVIIIIRLFGVWEMLFLRRSASATFLACHICNDTVAAGVFARQATQCNRDIHHEVAFELSVPIEPKGRPLLLWAVAIQEGMILRHSHCIQSVRVRVPHAPRRQRNTGRFHQLGLLPLPALLRLTF